MMTNLQTALLECIRRADRPGANALLAGAAAERALTVRLEKSREEERTRISREIHDELGQMLTGLKMDLRSIERQLDAFGGDPRVNPMLDKVISATELADAKFVKVQIPNPPRNGTGGALCRGS